MFYVSVWYEIEWVISPGLKFRMIHHFFITLSSFSFFANIVEYHLRNFHPGEIKAAILSSQHKYLLMYHIYVWNVYGSVNFLKLMYIPYFEKEMLQLVNIELTFQTGNSLSPRYGTPSIRTHMYMAMWKLYFHA